MSPPDQGNSPPPLPSASVEAETAVLKAQILTTGTAEGDDVAKVLERTEEGAEETKKPPQASLKNYFVGGHLLVDFQHQLIVTSASSPTGLSSTTSWLLCVASRQLDQVLRCL